MKHCKKCNTDKTLEEFYYDKNRNVYAAPCKDCRIKTVRLANHKWRKENPEKEKSSNAKSKLKCKYGLSLEDLGSLLEKQNFACAICTRPLSLRATKKASKPHVDHCHVTGVVRGLLCLTCNTGIGMFGDSSDLLDAAKEYILRHSALAVVEHNSASAPVSADNSQLVFIAE